jgi:hypothetical protein
MLTVAVITTVGVPGGMAAEAGSQPTDARGETRPVQTEIRVDVKFRAGAALDRPEELLPAALRSSVVRLEPLVTLRGERLDNLGAGPMRRWFRITLRDGVDADEFAAALHHLDVVEAVEPAPRPAPPP